MHFIEADLDISVLKERAYNLRWAAVPDDVIPLTAADPDFKSPQAIADALMDHTRQRYWSYGPAEGLPEFRAAMERFYQGSRNVPAKREHIMAVDSAAYGILLTCRAFLDHGDEAIVFDPVDFLFQYSVENAGGKALRYNVPQGCVDFSFPGLEALITARTRMICLCNPLNPTGKVFTRAELQILGDIAVRHNLIILSDEIWSDIIFKPFVFTSIASLSHAIAVRTVIVTGFSKSYGLAGLRIGAVTAFSDEIFSRLLSASLHNATVHGANTAGQVAAIAALTHCQPWLQEFKDHLYNMRQLCTSMLNNIPGVSCIAPEGCYVAFANITKTGFSSSELATLLLEKGRVAVVPGKPEWFGPKAEGYIRLSFATSGEILTEGVNRIAKTISGL